MTNEFSTPTVEIIKFQFYRMPYPLKQFLLSETYLFGCGGTRVNDEKQSTVLVCSFYPSLLKGRGKYPYKSKKKCKEDCRSCMKNPIKAICQNVKCISCIPCEVKRNIYEKRKFESLCGKVNVTDFNS